MYHTGTTGQDGCDRRPHVKLWVLCILSLSVLLQTGQSHAAQVHLSWKAPTASADGTRLKDLAGYYVYYWQRGQQVRRQVNIGLQNSYTLAGLTRGQTYRFAVTAYDRAGNESDFSNVFIVTIPAPSADSDGDGLTDAEELTVYGTDPQRADTDGDGLSDGAEVAWWRTKWQADADGDGLINLLDADADGDGVLDAVEMAQGTNPADATSVPMAETVQLWLEAEEGVLTSPMRVSEDDRASAGQYIWVPKGAGGVAKRPMIFMFL